LSANGFCQTALIDLADVREVNALYSELPPTGFRPARAIYQAAKLPFCCRVKVQLGQCLRHNQSALDRQQATTVSGA
jgi:hypothetical protein